MQKERRIGHFQKSLQELAELEVKHAKAHAQMLRQTINAIKTEVWKIGLEVPRIYVVKNVKMWSEWFLYKLESTFKQIVCTYR